LLFLILIGAGGVSLGQLSAAETRSGPQRILSMNLCIDQLLLQLVDRDRILSVAADSADPQLSSIADQVKGIPVNHGRAEEVIAFNPDLVLAGPFTTPHTAGLLQRLGYRVETIPLPRSFSEASKVITELADLLEVGPRGLEIARRLDADLAELQRQVGNRPDRPTAAFFEPNGFTPTAGTIGDRLLSAAGMENLAADLERPYLSLEDLISARPDFLVLQMQPGVSRSQAEALLEHPAMQGMEGYGRILKLPPLAWACGGPEAVAAARELARQAGTVSR
jgi:iron complex transport system substrate-binding protein